MLLKEKKASSLLSVAQFYEKQKRYASCLIYYQELYNKFPETEAGKIAEEKISIYEGLV